MCRFLLLILAVVSHSLSANAKMDFWNTQRKGTNFFNEIETLERFRSAKKIGVEVVRLVSNKWPSTQKGAKTGDFLLGPKNSYEGLVKEDLQQLKHVLNWADQVGIKIVLTNLSLPGLRWIQHNGDTPDNRLWEDLRYHKEAEEFWRSLARELNGHPAVVGYNILNEPHPEKVPPQFKDWYLGDYSAWYKSIEGTPKDLNLFHNRIAAAIRSEDAETPIVIDSGFYATPWAFEIMQPLNVRHVIYSFHMYEPYAFTSYQNKDGSGKQKYFYPGDVPIGESEPAPVVTWEAKEIDSFLQPIRDWQMRHHIPSNRIFASEFGLFRVNKGAAEYLRDVLSVFNREKWHWAFYSFREDTWAGMDYELGSQVLAAEKKYPLKERQKYYLQNPIFDTLLRGLAQ
ncbi:MAG: cellulase family glycosylhydrolase [Bdellovibrionales bacterium]|nr:cellulase family glycosylhydrolase [Bdellovibrionales bacterium]